MLKAKKVFNNNIVLAEDDKMEETILTGRGVGYLIKPGMEVDESKAEKIFRLAGPQQENLINVIKDIPIAHLELTKRIVNMAQKELNTQFDDVIFIGLTDHIHFAVKRAKQNEILANALMWEIRKFYPKEFNVAMKAIEMINYDQQVELSDDEAGFIAMHFVNAQQNSKEKKNTIEDTNTIQDILNIVKFHFKMNLDESSVNYTRFITHVRFFLLRAKQEKTKPGCDDFLFEKVKDKYPDTYHCVCRIKAYFESKLNIELNHDEMLYFMLHIHRLTQRENLC